MDLIGEGLRSVVLPCSLAVLVPGLVVVMVAGRSAVGAVAGYVAGLLGLSWIRFGGRFGVGYTTPALIVAALILLLGVGLMWSGSGRGEPRASERVRGVLGRVWSGSPRGRVAVGGAAIGGVAAWLWRPCVGLRLGSVLSSIGVDPWGNLVPLTLFVTGLMVPLVVLAALPVAWPRLTVVRDSTVLGRIGVAGAVVLAGALAVGLYDDVVVVLFRVSSF